MGVAVVTMPEHRRVLAGRTWPTHWSPASMDPIRRYRRTHSLVERVASVLLATLMGVAGAVLLIHWWSA